MGTTKHQLLDDEEGPTEASDWRQSDDEEEELLTPAGPVRKTNKQVLARACSALAGALVAALVLFALVAPRSPPHDLPVLRQSDQVNSSQQQQRTSAEPAGRQPFPGTPTALNDQGVPLCSYTQSNYCPARELFLQGVVHDAVTNNLMWSGQAFLTPGDKALAFSQVSQVMRNISINLKANAPVLAAHLDRVELNQMERDAVLKALNLVGNQRVQGIGRDVATAIRWSPSTDTGYLRSQLDNTFHSRAAELRSLRAQLVPEALMKSIWGKDYVEANRSLMKNLTYSKWSLSLDSNNVVSMSERPPESEGLPDRKVDYAAVTTEEKLQVLYGGALEEGRVLLDLLQSCQRLVRPAWTTHLRSTLEFGASELRQHCEAIPPLAVKVELSQALLCPLKFGAQGLDALRASFIDEMAANYSYNLPN